MTLCNHCGAEIHPPVRFALTMHPTEREPHCPRCVEMRARLPNGTAKWVEDIVKTAVELAVARHEHHKGHAREAQLVSLLWQARNGLDVADDPDEQWRAQRDVVVACIDAVLPPET